MRVATWNVNSIRTRVDRVTDWLARADVDVLAMQETKCTDAQFPSMPFAALGYEVAHIGLNQWNGVAIASRIGLDDVEIGFPGQPLWDGLAEARAIGATCGGGVRLWSLYIPNGRTLADKHYTYKLEWLEALRVSSAVWPGPVALMGDWNIAPTDEDVWDPAFFEGATHVSEPERAAFRASTTPGSPTWCGRTPPRAPPACTPTGTTRSCASRRSRHADRLHPGLAGVRRPRHACRDRPRGAQRQAAQRSRARAGRTDMTEGLSAPPLPPRLLLLLTVVTGVVDAFSYLALGHVLVANMTGNVVFSGFALAGAPGFVWWALLLAVAPF